MKAISTLPRATKTRHTCLVRVSLNITNPAESYRLTSALPTIRAIHKKGYRIILMSHRGRPNGVDTRYSLRSIAPVLARFLGQPVHFIPHTEPKKIVGVVAAAPGNIVLLENLRFHKGEHASQLSFAKTLASLGQIYVNDAFSDSHRNDASIVRLPRLLPSYAGILFMREVATLSRVVARSKKPLVLVVGGAKVPEKLHMIERFKNEAEAILVGGVTANTLLSAQGKDIGRSFIDHDMLPLAKKLAHLPHLLLPHDFIIVDDKIKDIGPLTIARFCDAIAKATSIIWNGPMGLFEEERFARGSCEIARAIAKSSAFSVAGGGDTTELITHLKLEKKMGFVSTGGGAMLEFLINQTLPGIEALNK